jgi:hypothetical protein
MLFMKIPFKKSTMSKLESNVAALAKRGEQLAAKRVTAQQTLDKAITVRLDAHLSGALDDDQRALDKLQTAVDTAKSALDGLDAAINVLAQQKAEAEAALHAERDRADREVAAQALEGQVAVIEEKFPEWLAASRAFSEALTAIGRLRHFESTEVARFIESATAQVEVASNLSLAELKAIPDMIRNGQAPIPREEPKPVPVVVVQPEPTRTLFCLGTVKWRDSNGRQCSALQYEDAQLPLALADKALRRGICVSVTDERRKTLKGARGGHHVNVDALDIVDLDDIDDPKAPYMTAGFRVIDRSSEERTIQISVPRL